MPSRDGCTRGDRMEVRLRLPMTRRSIAPGRARRARQAVYSTMVLLACASLELAVLHTTIVGRKDVWDYALIGIYLLTCGGAVWTATRYID